MSKEWYFETVGCIVYVFILTIQWLKLLIDGTHKSHNRWWFDEGLF